MQLNLPTPEQLSMVYDRDLKRSFPTSELKPLAVMQNMWAQGAYQPLCLFDGQSIVGEAFLWLGHPGWALLDYLCVAEHVRNRGLGAQILRLLAEREPDCVIFGETEVPAHAPNPAMARRRMGFYERCGLRKAGYETEIFGVHYQTLYLAGSEVDPAALMQEHRFVYANAFAPDKYEKYVRIPYDPTNPCARVAWKQE